VLCRRRSVSGGGFNLFLRRAVCYTIFMRADTANNEDFNPTSMLIAQVALVVLEELNVRDNRVKTSEIWSALLEKRDAVIERFTDKEFALGADNKAGFERWYFMKSFAATLLKFVGFVSGPHGSWEITEEGKDFLVKHKDDKEKMEAELAGSYVEMQRTRLRVGKKRQSDAEEVDESVAQQRFDDDDIRSSIYEYLEGLDPYGFQDLVGHLFQGMGYTVPYVSPKGPDGGVDIIAHKDAIGVDGPLIKIQVKHSQDRNNPGVGIDEVQRLRGLCSDGVAGVLVSLKGFTREAEKEVRKDMSVPITLIDSVRFVDLWIDHIDTITEEGKKMFPLKKVYIVDDEL